MSSPFLSPENNPLSLSSIHPVYFKRPQLEMSFDYSSSAADYPYNNIKSNDEEMSVMMMSSYNNNQSSSSSDEDMSMNTAAGDVEELRRGPWTVEEDIALANYISVHGEGRWNSLARCAGLNRTGKSCRLRWLNYLRPDVRRGNITPEEQLLILELHSRWGNRWSKIAQYLPGRTDNEIKNYWRTRVQKHAKQLKCDVNSQQFKDTMRYLWMPRLVERIQAASSTAASASASVAPPPTVNAASSTNTTLDQYDHLGGGGEFPPRQYRHDQFSTVTVPLASSAAPSSCSNYNSNLTTSEHSSTSDSIGNQQYSPASTGGGGDYYLYSTAVDGGFPSAYGFQGPNCHEHDFNANQVGYAAMDSQITPFGDHPLAGAQQCHDQWNVDGDYYHTPDDVHFWNSGTLACDNSSYDDHHHLLQFQHQHQQQLAVYDQNS